MPFNVTRSLVNRHCPCTNVVRGNLSEAHFKQLSGDVGLVGLGKFMQ